ncbi:hypothetical protein Fmac_019318 [Flemingia macrophylla]|uniref:Uncharacterized protein n=1 Tax=Flemingia macrophylla TaxID=520843 RepID=A0ABD1M7G2_9FABA
MILDLQSRGNVSEAKLSPIPKVETEGCSTLAKEVPELRSEESNNADSNYDPPLSTLSQRLGSKIARLEIPERGNVSDIFETKEESVIDDEDVMVTKSNLFVEDQDQDKEEEDFIP